MSAAGEPLPVAHIACCVDDSEASEAALAEAGRLRALTPGRLSLVHVVQWPPPYAGELSAWLPDPEPMMEAAREWLEGRAAATPGAEPVLLQGHPASAACEWAGDAGVDLIVCAAHRGALARLVVGSFTQYVIRHAPCPVLVVRSAPPAEG